MKKLALLLLSLILLTACAPSASKAPPARRSGPPPVVDSKQDFRASAIHMASESIGWVAGTGKILRTADGGRTWADVTPPGGKLPADPDVYFHDGTTAWIATSEANQGLRVYHTVDGGRIWETVTLNTAGQVDFAFPDAQHGWLLVKHDVAMGSMPVSIYRTADGGRTWDLISRGEGPENPKPAPGSLPIGGIKTGITFRDANAGWVTMESRESGKIPLWSTVDGGGTWKPQDLPIPDPYRQHTLTIYPPRFQLFKQAVLPVTFVPGYETVFYSTNDGGITWQAGAPVKTIPHDVGSTYSFFDHAHGWAGGSDQLFATTDGGKAWTAVSPVGALKGLKQLQFITAEKGWAITEKGLMQTADGGRTWSQVKVVAIPATEVRVTNHPSETIATQFITALLAHDVPGMKALLAPDRQALADSKAADLRMATGAVPKVSGTPYIDDETVQISSERAHYDFYVSLDSGSVLSRDQMRLRLRPGADGRWLVDDLSIPGMGRPWQYGEEDPIFSMIHMITPSDGWAETANGQMLMTHDGGKTWADVTPPDLPVQKLKTQSVWLRGSYLGEHEAWAVATDRQGANGRPIVTAFHTQDGGKHWTSTQLPLANGPIYGASLAAFDQQHAWVMVEPEHGMNSSPGSLYATADGGTTWRLVASVMADAPGKLPFGGRVQFTTSTRGWLAGNRASTMGDLLYSTIDGGVTWQPVDLGLSTSDAARQPTVRPMPTFGPDGRDGVLAVTFSGQSPGETRLYRTHDGGKTWQTQATRPSWAELTFRDADHGWVMDSGALYFTADGGASWQSEKAGPTSQPHQLQFLTDKLGWGLGKVGLWRTEDGARTWAPVLCYAPSTQGTNATTDTGAPIVNFPAFVPIGDQQARIYLASLLPAGEWVVMEHCRHVPGWAQPSGCTLEGVQAKTGKRITVWEGMVTGGGHLRFAAGPGSVLCATGHSTVDDLALDALTLVHLDENSQVRLPFNVWPEEITYKDTKFVLTGSYNIVYHVDPTTGKVSN